MVSALLCHHAFSCAEFLDRFSSNGGFLILKFTMRRLYYASYTSAALVIYNNLVKFICNFASFVANLEFRSDFFPNVGVGVGVGCSMIKLKAEVIM